jgi:hypothetical protein
VIDLVDVVSV